MQIAFLFWTYLVMDNPIKIQYIERTGLIASTWTRDLNDIIYTDNYAWTLTKDPELKGRPKL